MRHSRLFRTTFLTVLATLILSSPAPIALLQLPASIANPASDSLVPSWNPAVTCRAQVLTVEQFVGTVVNPKQASPRQGADYSGGALQLAGKVPAGSIVPSKSWPFSKRGLPELYSTRGPPETIPCTAKNADGAAVPTLVEIHGVTVVGAEPKSRYAECGSVFNNPKICDLNFHVCNAVLAPNCSESYPDSMHVFHVEIDMYWIHSKIAPSFPPPGSTIDIQGFAFWDDAHLREPWHSYSGWELHPLTAWRPSAGAQTLGASFDYNPTSPAVGDNVTFTAYANGGTSPYSYGWKFGNESSTLGFSVSHSFITAGSQNVTLNVADVKGFRFTTSQLLTILDPPYFQLSSDSSKISISRGSSNTTTIRASSFGFTGRLTLSAQVPSENITVQLNPTRFTLFPADSRSVTMKAVIRPDTEPGSYPVTVEASSNGVTRVIIITLDIPSFDFSVDSSSLDIAPGSIGSFSITLSSLGGFLGPVTISPTPTNLDLSLSLNPSTVELVAGASANTTLTVNSSTPGMYNVVLTATNGIIRQQLPLLVNVDSAADFAITPSSLMVVADPGTSRVATVTVTSLNGFSGDVNLTVESDPTGAVIITPSTVSLTRGTTVPIQVTISTVSASARQYSITITGNSGIIRHSSRIMVNVSSPSNSSLYWEAAAIMGGIGAAVVMRTAWSRSRRQKAFPAELP